MKEETLVRDRVLVATAVPFAKQVEVRPIPTPITSRLHSTRQLHRASSKEETVIFEDRDDVPDVTSAVEVLEEGIGSTSLHLRNGLRVHPERQSQWTLKGLMCRQWTKLEKRLFEKKEKEKKKKRTRRRRKFVQSIYRDAKGCREVRFRLVGPLLSPRRVPVPPSCFELRLNPFQDLFRLFRLWRICRVCSYQRNDTAVRYRQADL